MDKYLYVEPADYVSEENHRKYKLGEFAEDDEIAEKD